jgi:signal transduction histidine kinase
MASSKPPDSTRSSTVPHQKRRLSAREEAVHSREDAVNLREEALRTSEDAARTGAEMERLMAQMRDANGRLIVAAAQAQTMSEEARDEAARAETEIERLMGQMREVNERLVASTGHAQAMVEEAERANRLKDEFLGTISHELRTPLNAILGYASMLRTGEMKRNRRTQALEIVERNATALAHIVEDVLDISRIISGKIELNAQRVDLSAVVDEAVATIRPTADSKAVRLQTVVELGHPIVSGDPDRLRQVMWNLLSNAVKFTPSGGQIHVRLERVSAHVEVVVSDTGRGIRPDFLPHVFERFRQGDASTTREFRGLGLGLAISRQIVELHGGTILAASDGERKGATFRVRLPLSARYLVKSSKPRTRRSSSRRA